MKEYDLQIQQLFKQLENNEEAESLKTQLSAI